MISKFIDQKNEYAYKNYLTDKVIGICYSGAAKSLLSELLEGEVLEEAEHRLPPHQQVGWLVHLKNAAVDQLDGVPERTDRVSHMIGTYSLPVERRS